MKTLRFTVPLEIDALVDLKDMAILLRHPILSLQQKSKVVSFPLYHVMERKHVPKVGKHQCNTKPPQKETEEKEFVESEQGGDVSSSKMHEIFLR